MEKRSLTHRLENSQLTQMALFPIKLMAVLLSMVILFVSLPLSALAANNGSSAPEEILTENVSSSTADIIEIPENRSVDSKTFRLTDGSFYVAHYNTGIHEKDESGNWQDIDNRLYNQDGLISTKDGKFAFPSKTSSGAELFSLDDGKHSVSFAVADVRSGVAGEISNQETKFDETADPLDVLTTLDAIRSSVSYADILPETDIEYVLYGTTVKESLILKSFVQELSYSFILSLEGLSLVCEEGTIYLLDDETNDLVYRLPAPVMWDSEDAFSNEIEVVFEKLENGSFGITYLPDSEWLIDSERVYPVTIDPSVYSSSSSVIDLEVNVGNPWSPAYDGSDSLYVSNGWNVYWRLTTLPQLPLNAYITCATISMQCFTNTELDGYIGVYEVMNDWPEFLYWQQVLDGTAGVPAEQFTDCVEIWTYNHGLGYELNSEGMYTWNVTPIVKNWYEGNNYGLMFQPVGDSFTGTAKFYSNDYNTSSVRPQLTISYADLKGVEDYWSFTSQDAGFAGTAYVHNATGNLVVNIPTLTSTDALLPVTPALVYNSCLKNSEYEYGVTQTANDSSFTPYGFKLNLNETLIKKAYTDASGNTAYWIIWADSDGTEHYFSRVSNQSNIYEDEDGLHLTIRDETSYCTMTDSNGIVKTFSSGTAPTGLDGVWYLSRITDQSGNTVRIYLNSEHAPISVSLIPKNESEIEQLQIAYNLSDKPFAIYNPTSGEGVVFLYSNIYYGQTVVDSGKYLRKVVRAHGGTTFDHWSDFYDTNGVSSTAQITVDAVAEYTYNSTGFITQISNNLSKYRLFFTADSEGRVASCQEYSFSDYTYGQKITYAYGTSSTVIRSSGEDDTHGTSDDLLTTYLHDSLGRTTGIYTTDLNQTQIYAASSGQYVGQGDWTDGTGRYKQKAKNSLKSSVQTTQTSSNYLMNGGFDAGSFQYWFTTGQTYCDSSITADSLYAAELRLTSTVSSSSVCQYVDLCTGDYSLSLDINTHDVPDDVSVYLKAESLDNSAHSVVKQLPVNEYYATGKYAFASLDFSADPAVSGDTERFRITVLLTGTVSGTESIWIDNVMLSKTTGACTYDMTTVGHFEYSYGYAPSSFWSYLDYESIPVTTADSGNDLFHDVLHIDASFDEIRFAQQKVYQATDLMKADYLDGYCMYDTEPILFTVSGWAKGTGQSYSLSSNFCIRAVVKYYSLSGTSSTKSYTFNCEKGLTDWQFVSGVFVTDPTRGMIDSITILLMYNGHQGEGFFDNISIVRSDSGSSVYEYGSSLGHLSKAVSGGKTVTYTYSNDDGNKVETVVNQGRKTYTAYTYDAFGRVLTETRGKYSGIYGGSNMVATDLEEISYTYNTYGLNTAIESTDKEDVSLKTKVEKTYEDSSGSHIFGALLSETDTSGQTTTYFYNPNTGYLEAVLYPDGTGLCYTYDGMGNLTEVLPAEINTLNGYDPVTGKTDVEYGYDTVTKRLSSISTFAETGRTTTYTFAYDGFGNPEETKVGTRTLASYSYNSNNGKLNTLTYGNELNVRYVYDQLDRISEVQYRQGSSGSFTTAYSYTYNAAGQVYSIKDHESDEVALYKYNAAGKVIGSYVYDETNELNKYGSTVYYDEQSRVSMVFHSFDYPYSSGTTYDNTYYSYWYNGAGTIRKFRTSGNYVTGSIEPEYDNLGRTKTRTLDYNIGGTDAFYNKLTYSYESNGNYTTGRVSQVSSEIRKGANTSILSTSTYKFVYDDNGNITQVMDAGNVILYRYEYDSLGQLKREDNKPLNQSYKFEYDHAGNITSKKIYAFTTGILGVALDTVTYSYNDSSWGDLLTGFDGTSITYDTIGNPTQIGNTQLTWKGRQLQSYSPGFYYNTSFTYNADGIRTSKTYTAYFSDTRHEYILDGSQIVKETVFVNNLEEYCLVYLYDETGLPIGFRYRTPSYAQKVFDGYFYEKNIQGDIIGIWDQFGTKIVSYSYDAWGNVTVSGIGANEIGTKNPYRYRGYYYDVETGLYYLQTRYYNPGWGRFINADSFINPDGDILGFNMFAYCGNNPVLRMDLSGRFWISALLIAVVSTVCIVVLGGCAPQPTSNVGIAREYDYVEGSNDDNAPNCYAYAIGSSVNEQPGQKSGVFPKKWYDVEDVGKSVEADMKAQGYTIRRISGPNEKIYSNEYKIALRVGTKPYGILNGVLLFDYHFMRQTNTGQWAEKHGRLGDSVLWDPGMTPDTIPWTLGGIEYYDSKIIYYAVGVPR